MVVRRSDLRFPSLNSLFAVNVLIVKLKTGQAAVKKQEQGQQSSKAYKLRKQHGVPSDQAARLTAPGLHSQLPWRRDGRPTVNPSSEIYGLAAILISVVLFWKIYVTDSFSPGKHNNFRAARPLTPLALPLLAAHSTMSFFGMGRPQPSSAEKIAAVEQEMKLMASMHNRMIQMCTKKCLPTDYREGDLNKGESVCLDRCAAKFFEAHTVVSTALEKESQARGGPGAGAGGGFGFGG